MRWNPLDALPEERSAQQRRGVLGIDRLNRRGGGELVLPARDRAAHSNRRALHIAKGHHRGWHARQPGTLLRRSRQAEIARRGLARGVRREVLLRAVRLLPQHIVDLSFPRACEGLNDHRIMSDTFEEASRTRKRQPREEPYERLA